MSNIAVIELAGAQYLVEPGSRLYVNKLDVEAGASFTPSTLLSTDGDKILYSEGNVKANLTEHRKGKKLLIIKFKAKSRYRRKNGHRQHLSVIDILSINGEKAEAKPIIVRDAPVLATPVVDEVVPEVVTTATKAKTKKRTSKKSTSN